MVDRLADAIRTLREMKAALAEAQDALAGARFARRKAMDEIAGRVYDLNEADRQVTFWRCMTADERATLDGVCARTAPTIAHWTPIERSLKQGVREAEIDLKNASRNRGKSTPQNGEKPGKNRGTNFPRLKANALRERGPGNRPPGSPRGPGKTGDSPSPKKAFARQPGDDPVYRQMDLFGDAK